MLQFSGSLSSSQVVDELGLQSINDRPWVIQGTSAISGQGIHEAMEQLVEMMKKQRHEGKLDRN